MSMLSRDNSSKHWFSLILIAVFMLFATPTPIPEGGASESARTSVSQGMEYFTNQATVRKQSSVSEGMRFAAFLTALSLAMRSLLKAAPRMLPETHLSFHPRIARLLTRMLLTPIKFTSLYV